MIEKKQRLRANGRMCTCMVAVFIETRAHCRNTRLALQRHSHFQIFLRLEALFGCAAVVIVRRDQQKKTTTKKYHLQR